MAALNPGSYFGGTFRALSNQVIFCAGMQEEQWPDPARPQQAHLDIMVDDLDAGEQRALALGATRLNGGGETFRVFADPAGHPFCLTAG